jgi:hypothetical protein
MEVEKIVENFLLLLNRVTGDDYRRPVVIEVTVEEAVTGRRQNNSMQIILHKYKYTMDLLRTAEYYKPGMKYTAFVSLHFSRPIKHHVLFHLPDYIAIYYMP